MINYFPKYFSKHAIGLYFIVLIVVLLLFTGQFMSWYWLVMGIIEVVGFFLLATKWSKSWEPKNEKNFEKELWGWGLGIRLVYVLFSYFFYKAMTGIPFEFGAADAQFYDIAAQYGASQIREGHLWLYPLLERYCGGLQLSDSGYPIYLSFLYSLLFDSILLSRVVKAVLSTWTVVLLYHLGRRHFEESTARMAAIFALLMPNLIFYTGLQLKGCEMVFLTVVFVERTDALLLSKRFTFKTMILPILLMGSLFFFRTVLGAAAVLSFVTTLFFSETHKVGWGRRIVLVLWIGLVALFFVGGTLMEEVQRVWKGKDTNQEVALQWYAEREGGNQLAKYASTAVFAPLIFTLPFPTMVETPGQENMRMIHGGNFIKNVLSFFTLWAMFILFIRKRNWREHLLPLSFMLFYLAIIAMSAFAQSERFHQPALPFVLLFAAYGVSEMRLQDKKWFNLWMVILFVACVSWSWFKLAGRGM